MRPNQLIERWRQGKSATNCWLSLGNLLATEILAHQGWHSLTVDLQHGSADYAQMCAMLTAISTTSVTPLVRVPWNNPGDVMRALDAGAYGIVCPNVDTRQDCERFVSACRYAPLGTRSFGPRRAMLYAGADYVEHANTTLLAIVQIESATALANVDDIAKVEGLDMLYVGPSDTRDPVTVEAIDAILKAAKRAKLRSGIYCRSAEYALAMVEKGFDLVTVTSDEGLLGIGTQMAARFEK